MKPPILLVGRELPRMAQISLTLDPREYTPVIAGVTSPLAYFAAYGSQTPAGAVVELLGTENIVEVEEALQKSNGAAIVFLIDRMPPSAAMARVASDRAVFLDKAESALTISATLIALVFQRTLQAKQA
jgi:hypothetical protein